MNGRIHIYRREAYGYLKRTPIRYRWGLYGPDDRLRCEVIGSAREARKKAKKIIDENRERFTERTS